MPTPRLRYVRPGRTAQRWICETVAELKADDPLAPVTLIVPNYYAGRQLRWLLARAGGFVNVRTMLLGDLATQLLVETDQTARPLTAVLEESAVREAVRRVGGALAPLAHHRALHQTLLHLFREVRRGDAALDGSGGAMARAASAAYTHFQEVIAPFADRTRLRELAAERISAADRAPAAIQELGALVVYQLPRLDPADVRLLAALARWTGLCAAFARFEDADGLANAMPNDSADRLIAALGSGMRPSVGEIPTDSGATNLEVIRAPDPSEEIREVIRAIARGLGRDPPTPLHRIAILYRQTDPYGSLVREALTLAGLPWSALDGRRLADSRPGRALLAALEIRERDFAREAVLAWVDVAPADRTQLPGSAWDRLSRAANIVRGANQWQQRLHRYAVRQHALAAQREEEAGEVVAGNVPAAVALRREASLVERMQAVIADLEQNLARSADGASWGELVSWVETVWHRHCGGADAWTADDQGFAVDITRALAELRDADLLENPRTVPLHLFLQTVRETLEERARPVGSLGQGILVGPIQAVSGLAFDQVYVVGMAEQAFPTPPRVDPFLPPEGAAAAAARDRQRATERLAFRTAVAAADGGRLTLSVPDALADRKSFPSPWLLELAAEPAGQSPLLTAGFHQLTEPAREPWLRVVSSNLDGLLRAPDLSDLEERRLQSAASSASLHVAPIAQRADLPLGRGLHMLDARASANFSSFDGNVEDILSAEVEQQRLLDTVRVISASGIEAWAACPFQFFVGRVLRVQPTERPEEAATIDPLERGTLVHRILERFLRALQEQERIGTLGSYTASDRLLMDEIADQCIADLEQRGAAGHALVWENTVATIRADLHIFLTRDEVWRQSRGLRPTFFEQPFGFESNARSWQPLALRVGDVDLGFRGVIDRIDLGPDRTAFLYDYKTGGASGYRDLNADPLMGGRHVQLALYRRAVLESVPGIDEVDGAFWFVSSKGEFKMLPAEPSTHDVDQRLDQVLDVTARGIRGGMFPQVPGTETSRPGRFSWENCVYCPYDRVCPSGRDAVWERKQDSPGHVQHRSLAPMTPLEPGAEDA